MYVVKSWWILAPAGIVGLHKTVEFYVKTWGSADAQRWWNGLPSRITLKQLLGVALVSLFAILFERSYQLLQDVNKQFEDLKSQIPTETLTDLEREKDRLESEIEDLIPDLPTSSVYDTKINEKIKRKRHALQLVEARIEKGKQIREKLSGT